VKEYYGVSWPSRRRTFEKKVRKWGAKFASSTPRGEVRHLQRERLGLVTGIWASHPTASCASTTTPATPRPPTGARLRGRDALVLTNDNSGDGLCATASTGRGLALERHEATPSAPGSVGAFLLLRHARDGHEVREHEYKVMGMAPYAPEKYAARAEAALRESSISRPAGPPASAGAPRASATSSCCAPWSASASTGSRAARSGCSRRCCCAEPPHARALRRRAARPGGGSS